MHDTEWTVTVNPEPRWVSLKQAKRMGLEFECCKCGAEANWRDSGTDDDYCNDCSWNETTKENNHDD